MSRRRIRVRCPVVVEGESVQADALCVDISAGGCAIETFAGPPVGSTVVVLIDLPGFGRIRAAAEVVRANGEEPRQELGLRLVELDQSNLVRLHTYLAATR